MHASNRPAVSVVLPVYNCPEYVGEAVESMLRQSFEDFELIVIDDGSTDETPRVLERYTDARIRKHRQVNHGLAATLNRAIALARGAYIARQDQDDFSHPDRLGKQVEFLESHPNCGLVGTWAEIWQENVSTGRRHCHPQENSRLQYELLTNNPFVHSSVMMRKSALEDIGGYSTDPDRQPPEDYELWSRLARSYEVANLPELLHTYREIKGSMSRDGSSPFLKNLIKICSENIACAARLHPTDTRAFNIACLVHGAPSRLHGKPDIGEMRTVFRLAAERVVSLMDRAQIGDEAERTIEAMRYSYPEVFGTSLFARKVRALARRAAAFLNTHKETG